MPSKRGRARYVACLCSRRTPEQFTAAQAMSEDTITSAVPIPPTDRRASALIIGAGLAAGILGGLYFVSPRTSAALMTTAARTTPHTDTVATHQAPRPVHMIENLV